MRLQVRRSETKEPALGGGWANCDRVLREMSGQTLPKWLVVRHLLSPQIYRLVTFRLGSFVPKRQLNLSFRVSSPGFDAVASGQRPKIHLELRHRLQVVEVRHFHQRQARSARLQPSLDLDGPIADHFTNLKIPTKLLSSFNVPFALAGAGCL
jgi:hypothetical protein